MAGAELGSPTAATGAGAPAATPPLDAAAQRAATRAAIMQGAASRPSPAAQPAPVAPPVAPAAAPPVPIAADLGKPAESAAPAPAGAEPTEPTGVAAVRKLELHLRKQLAGERAQMQAEFDAQKIAWQRQMEGAGAKKPQLDNALQDPIGALKALGFAEGDFDALGRLIYAHSPEGQKDPRNKAAATATAREREQASAIETLSRELSEFKQGLQTREQQAHERAQLDAFAEGIARAAGDATPVARAGLSSNPSRTRQALIEVADQLYMDSGPSHELRDVPGPAEVLAAYESKRRTELEAMRAEYEAITGVAPAAAPAVGQPASAPLGQSPAQNPPARLSRAELIAGIQKLRSASGT